MHRTLPSIQRNPYERGFFQSADQPYSSAERIPRIAEQYYLSPLQLLTLYEELPTVSEERLHSLCHIIGILVRSFWQDGLITCNRSMLSVKIERYINSHLGEKIGPDEICNEFFLSKNAVYQLFHKEFHTTVNDFITKKRLLLAQELLRSKPELNVTQIAALCGFPDYNYFIRTFRKQIGITPLQWRKLKT